MPYRDVVYRGFASVKRRLRTLIKGQSKWERLTHLRTKGVRFEVVDVNDYRMKVDLNDNVITPHLFLNGEWEPYESEVMTRLLRPGMTFIDVGAHVGYYSLLAARVVSPNGRVISFEPSPDNYTLLTQNIELNQFSHVVHAENAALAEKSGERSLYLSTFNTGDHRIYETLPDDDEIFNAGSHRESVRVPAVSLDEYLRQRDISQVDAIKIDVQGAEMGALSGMRRTLSSNPDIVLFTEFWPHGLRRFGTDPQALLSFLQDDIGLSLFHILPEEKRLVSVEPSQFLSTARNADPVRQVDLLCCFSHATVLEKVTT